MILAATTVLGGFLAFHDAQVSDEQVNLATAALNRHDRGLFPHDPVYGSSNLWQLHTPVFQGVLDLVLVPTAYEDPLLGFRVLAAAVIGVYLCSMYALLWRQCRSWSVAVFVAVLSTTVTYAPGGSFWGIGPLATITPRGVCIAFAPLIFLGLLGSMGGRRDGEQPWRTVVIFACAGLLGNLHLPTGIHLTILLAIAYLAARRARPSSWPVALGGLAAAAAGALPYTAYYVAIRSTVPLGEGAAGYVAARQALAAGGAELLYPDLLKQLVEWAPYVAALAIPAGAVLVRAGRFRLRHGALWLGVLVGGLTVGLGAHGLGQLHARAHDLAPETLLAGAAALVMLPLYVLLAQALTNLFRVVRTHRGLLRWVCFAAMVAWMLPADNLHVARHGTYRAASSFMPPPRRPTRVRELAERRQARAERAAVGRWLREHSDRGAVVLTDRAELRLAARRSIPAAEADLDYYYRLAPGRLEAWRLRLRRQRRLLSQPVRPSDLVRFATAFARRRGLPPDTPVLAVVPAPLASPELNAWEVPSRGWGRFVRLYRVRVSEAPSTGPGTRAAP
ncbi:MAG: hypothetical protein ACOC8F_04120 [Planctomycetota bacterium]